MTTKEITERLEKFYANGSSDSDLAIAFMLEGVPDLLRLAEAGKKLREALDKAPCPNKEGFANDCKYCEALAAYDEEVS